MADHAVRVGPPAAAESYLRIPNVIAAAVTTGCQAVHPGYGFLAENPAFVEACVENDLVFVGPPADVMAMMGDKISAKQAMRRADVPTVPGTEGETTVAEARQAADEMGYPILLKASAGGGGKGMRLVQASEDDRGRVLRGGGRGAGRVRRPAALRREGGRAGPSRRDPGPLRPLRQRADARRARVLDPAPPPEADRGVAVGRADARDPRGRWRPPPSARAAPSGIATRARSSSCSARTGTSTSSS